MDNEQQRILDLRKELNRHNNNYYVNNAPEISDQEFDRLMHELETLEAKHPEMDDELSPTRRVGSDLSGRFEQVSHIYPMLSLSNTYTVAEVDDFVNRCRESLPGLNPTIVGELKFDGTSISLIYEQGRLVRAVTRGDGEKGDVVTANVKTIKSIPLELSGSGWPEKFEIRGEILLPWEAFDRLNAEREMAGEPLFANPRNAAAGTLKTQSPAEVARRGLDARLYYLLGENLPYDSHFENMEAARSWGFKVSPSMKRLNSIEEVDAFISYWDSERKTLPVATDGLVFKIDNLKQQLNLGYRAKSPRWAIAYKFQAERALTQLRFVSFEVGRSGLITPVSNLEPVLLSGTIVKRASLHNEDIMRQLDIHEHDWLYVEKGGEIIPKITGVDVSRRTGDASKVEFVKTCPSCGTTLVRQEGEAAWVCPNHKGCAPQIEGRLEHFAARRMMDIDGIGEETARLLVSMGLAKDPADLYDLTPQQLTDLERFGDKSASRILQGLEDSKSVPFDRVVYALSIPYVGETVAKRLARAALSMERLSQMSIEELQAVGDIGPRIAASVYEFLRDPDNSKMIERLAVAGLQMQLSDTDTNRSNILDGKKFVISGTFARHSRDQYKEMIENNGGKNIGSVSKATDYIIAGDNMGPAKFEKAQKLGIPIISEDDFLRMIGLEDLD